jgi:hypothetical protein
VAHAEELTNNMHLINIMFSNTTKSKNFLTYSWGDDLNEVEKRKMFTERGINGIIYDRIDENKSPAEASAILDAKSQIPAAHIENSDVSS